jgi:hypothetical protein
MNKTMKLFLLMSVMFSACKVREVTQKYAAAVGSTFTIYNKTYAINKITVDGRFVNTYADSTVIDGKTGVGNITWVFFNETKGTKTYLIDSTPTITNPSYVALRFDFVVNNEPPVISIVSAPQSGETLALSRKDGKLVMTSKGVTMTNGSKLSFNIKQQ